MISLWVRGAMSVIWMYLGYNWLITQKTLPINAFFVNSKQWLQVMFTYQRFVLVLTIYSFDFFLGWYLLIILGLISTYSSVLWLVISDISQYKTLWCMVSLDNKWLYHNTIQLTSRHIHTYYHGSNRQLQNEKSIYDCKDTQKLQ